MSKVQAQAPSFTADQISAAVAELRATGKALRRSVEKVLVMAVFDSIVNESADTANALVGALRTSTKRTGIVEFLHVHGQLYSKDGKVFQHFALGVQAKLAWTPDYVTAVKDAAEDWEDFKPTPPVAELDMVKAVNELVKRHDKAIDAGKPVVDGELAEYLSKLVAQYTARKATQKAQADSKGATVAVAVAVKEAAIAD